MRYRLKTATWTVVRERNAPSPRLLSTPAAVAELARDLLRDADDDREHFWAVYVDAQNCYRYSLEVSVGSQNASLVHPREVFGPALRLGAVALILIHNHPSGDAVARGHPAHAPARRVRPALRHQGSRPCHRGQRYAGVRVARRAGAAVSRYVKRPRRADE